MDDNHTTIRIIATIVGGFVALVAICCAYNYAVTTAAFKAGYEETTIPGHAGTVWAKSERSAR